MQHITSIRLPNLKSVREAAGLNVDDLAYRSRLSIRTIYGIQNGEYTKPSTAKIIAHVLKTTVEELKGDK